MLTGMDEIVIEAEAKPSTIGIALVGKTYQGRPPKTVAMINLSQAVTKKKSQPAEMVGFLHKFLEMTFGKKDANAIMKRLEDPQDTLEIGHISQLMEALISRSAGENPTT